jgi:hypothetical protein
MQKKGFFSKIGEKMQFRGVLTVLEVFLGCFEAFFEVFEGF